jgi:hypothetical protein
MPEFTPGESLGPALTRAQLANGKN